MAPTTEVSAPAAQDTPAKETQMPEWEHIAAKEHGAQNETDGKTRGSTKEALQRKLDNVMPPHKKYIGLRRTVFLLVLLGVFLALLALIIGLAAGLSSKSSR